MVIGGATIGGARGLYTGLTDSAIKQLPTVYIQRTQILNHVTKSGANLSQTAGSVGLLYALADFAIHKLRGGADDEINTVTAATATGCLYKSPAELRCDNHFDKRIVVPQWMRIPSLSHRFSRNDSTRLNCLSTV
ncbi:Mitochondrial import inner membrane translocase subunit Tim23 [Fasciola gigantica]|uniref:Mitochondrial import inner membrane translocase subunit Tim23 n=1 Tax=Fasciola gigantica TaxID=46835 RepID=A0A504Y9T9_FASGI|nr:Mitochondrial import inner membrane translocase subunit Tim23 [Fasciola gigantica]